MPFRIARSFTHVLISLAIALPLSTGRSELGRDCDASLDFVGHLISGFHDFTLDPLDPTYPRCF